jgi:hypothetical protein
MPSQLTAWIHDQSKWAYAYLQSSYWHIRQVKAKLQNKIMKKIKIKLKVKLYHIE